MADEKKYWFPAKRVGWGWGLPTTWQGWMVIVVFVMLMGAGGAYFRPQHRDGYFFAYTGVLCVLLILVCWLKGEPPRWRRGD